MDNKTIIIGVVGAALVASLSIVAINKDNLKYNIFNTPKTTKQVISTSEPITKKKTTGTTEDNRRMVKVKVNSKEKIKDTIIKTIKNKLNKDFDTKDYEYKVVNGPDGKIYHFNYIFKDVRVLHGYVAYLEKNTIEIYDNMGDFLNTLKKGISYDESLDDKNKIDAKIQELLAKYKEEYKDYDTTLYSTQKRYDDDNEKVVLDISFKISSKATGGTSVFSDTFYRLD